MVNFFGFRKVDQKKLFDFGRYGFILTLMILGFLIITNTLDKQDDLKSYYNFWQFVYPNPFYE